MQTWLDFYIYKQLDKYSPHLRKTLGINTDLEALLMSVVTDMKMNQSVCDNEVDESRLLFDIAVYPFLAYAAGQGAVLPWAPETRALKVDSSLIRDFAQASAPETDAWTMLVKTCSWYFDIPHKALVLDNQHEIRAIFLSPTQAGTHCIHLITTEKGSDLFTGRLGWIMEHNKVTGVTMPGVDKSYIKECVDNLVRLILLYRLTSDYTHDNVPHISHARLKGMSTDKARCEQRKSSVFRMVAIKAPSHSFGRTGETSRSWQLSYRVEVRGHFRWQPHGPEHSLRRLQWIAAHVRGAEHETTRVDIEKLK